MTNHQPSTIPNLFNEQTRQEEEDAGGKTHFLSPPSYLNADYNLAIILS